jgi:hypothetical protein
MTGVEGRVAMVTGATSGIGAATAQALAEGGAHVALASRRGGDLGIEGALAGSCDVRDVEQIDSFGRRRVVPTRTYMERKGFVLQPKFVFIDGRTGTVMHSENFREEVLYNANQSTPALSSYFELMDRLIPSFLSTLSSQKIKGTRVLLQ